MSAVAELLADDEDVKVPEHLKGAFAVLRRGLKESPELRVGLGFTVIVSLGVTVASLVTPVLVQQIFDKGFTPTFNARFVYGRCAAAFLLVVLAFLAARSAGRRLVTASENALMHLRVRTFRHIHALSIAEQSEEKRGVFVPRVTADVDALQEFMEWGGIAWIISVPQAVGALLLMLYYSWQLATAIIVLLIPLLIVVWSMQARLSAAFNAARTRVGEMLSEVSESVMGAAVVRAYGLDEQTHDKVEHAISERYKAEVLAHFRAATFWPMSSIFYAVALSTRDRAGLGLRQVVGLTFGQVSAFLFLATCSCTCSPTSPRSTARPRRDRGLAEDPAVLDLDIEVVEPANGRRLPADPCRSRPRTSASLPRGTGGAPRDHAVGAGGRSRRDRRRDRVRQDDLREADVPLGGPALGRIVIGGVDLRDVRATSRRTRIRMVPQDGFLFGTTVRENVRYGPFEGATDPEVEAAFVELGLSDWVAGLAGRARDTGRRARRSAERRRAPAGGARACADRRPGAADPRRGDVGRRPGDRATDHRSAPTAVGGRTVVTIAHTVVDGRGGAAGVRLRRWEARPGGDARRAGDRRRPVRRALPELARQRARRGAAAEGEPARTQQ
jgi:putative ABC transport system ATP-binding protein